MGSGTERKKPVVRPSNPRNTAAWTRRPLKDIDAIFAEMKDGKITGRMVIDLPR
ncbi:hypothetical protein PEC301875_18350 [Pectobacterium carotovorum subsp. carotovorum]|nr:hypothetical protein PEC301875_18350 [Pectobacterium carotovorum subsp. carotovorum]